MLDDLNSKAQILPDFSTSFVEVFCFLIKNRCLSALVSPHFIPSALPPRMKSYFHPATHPRSIRQCRKNSCVVIRTDTHAHCPHSTPNTHTHTHIATPVRDAHLLSPLLYDDLEKEGWTPANRCLSGESRESEREQEIRTHMRGRRHIAIRDCPLIQQY